MGPVVCANVVTTDARRVRDAARYIGDTLPRDLLAGAVERVKALLYNAAYDNVVVFGAQAESVLSEVVTKEVLLSSTGRKKFGGLGVEVEMEQVTLRGVKKRVVTLTYLPHPSVRACQSLLGAGRAHRRACTVVKDCCALPHTPPPPPEPCATLRCVSRRGPACGADIRPRDCGSQIAHQPVAAVQHGATGGRAVKEVVELVFAVPASSRGTPSRSDTRAKWF